METTQMIIGRIRKYLPGGADPTLEVREETLLSDLGVQSLHLISLVLRLQEEHALDISEIDHLGMPVTVGDLVKLIELKSPVGKS